MPIVDVAAATPVGVGTVSGVGEQAVGGTGSVTGIVRVASSLPPGRLLVGSLTPATDAARAGLGQALVVVLPNAALMGSPLRAFIFVQQDSGSFVQRRVIVEYFVPSGSANPGTTTVIAWSGVRGGERVVVRGVDSLLAIFSRAVLTDEDQHERLRPPP